MKAYCQGGGTTDFETRPGVIGDVLAKCPYCTRVLKPTSTGHLRQHQPRNEMTRSLDRTRDILWNYAAPKVAAAQYPRSDES